VRKRASVQRVSVRLSRGGRIFARAEVRRSGPVTLRAVRRLVPGAYDLVTVVTEGGRSARQAAGRLVVPPPIRAVGARCGHARRGGRSTVSCSVRLAAGPRTLRVEVRLVRGGRTFARATTQASGAIDLRGQWAIPPGRYTVVTTVSDGATERVSRRRLTVPRPAPPPEA
jgi:hypothetical protein